MKTPRLVELKRLNQSLRTRRRTNYRRVLSVAITQWIRLGGDPALLGYLRSKRYDLLYRSVDALVSQSYDTAAKHFAAHQLAALVRKFPWDPAEVQLDPEAEAKRSFFAAEHRCKWMNKWARAAYRRNYDNTDLVIRECRRFIRSVIGNRPDLPSIYSQCDVTGGAAIGVHGNATNLGRKLLAESWSVSPTALPYFASALNHHYHYQQKVLLSRQPRDNGEDGSEEVPMAMTDETFGHIDLAEGRCHYTHYLSEQQVRESCSVIGYNKVAFVPKTAKTFRSIAVEPLGNGFVQKGIDLFLRNRLKRVGLDLSDQSLNVEMARQGSIDHSEEGFCTIDLSSASDSISIGIVELLLPRPWFNFLNRVRSPSYELDGVVRRYEKFCSMGNGFCFPLETLIFASVCHAVGCGRSGKDFRVYGDDIIVRRKAFDDVVFHLKRFGFKVNRRKTFSSGPFRESCGGNWYLGEDVTPFTLDFELDNLSSLFKAINLSRRNRRTTVFLEEVTRFLVKQIPDQWLFLRPYKGPPDSAIDFLDLQLKPNWHRNKHLQCPSWYELQVRPAKDVLSDSAPSWVVMAAALRGHPSNQLFTLRRRTVTRVRLVARSGDATSLSQS